MRYPIELEPDTNGTLLVSFPDLPWVTTFGDDQADALAHAADAFDTAIDYLIRERQRIPSPSRATGPGLDVPILTAAKIALHNMMLAEGVTRAALGRRLHVHRPQVDRLLDARHATRIDEVERAFGTFGKRLEVSVRPDLTAPPAPRRTAKRASKR